MSYRHVAYSLTCVLLSFSVARSAGRPYLLTDLGDLPGGANESSAYSINSYGQVVGWSSTAGTTRAFLWSPTTPNGTAGSMVDLGDLPGGTDQSAAFGMNALGQVVGFSKDASGNRAFLWTPTQPNGSIGSMIDLGGLPGGTNNHSARGINSLGQVVGEVSTTAGTRAFLWSPTIPNGTSGSMIDLGELPSTSGGNIAYAINSFGQVVGKSGLIGGRAFLWTPTVANGTDGSMIDLGGVPPDAENSRNVAYSINARGQVVGLSATDEGRAFLWTPIEPNGSSGAMADLGKPAGQFTPGSIARSVNSQGQVAGGFVFEANGFLWTPSAPNGANGTMFDLSSLLTPNQRAHWTLFDASGINDFGQISGQGLFDPDGSGGTPAVAHAILLTPIPEPDNLTMVVVALLLAMCYRALLRSSYSHA